MCPAAEEEDLLEGVVSVPSARVPKYNPDRWVAKGCQRTCDLGRKDSQ